MVAILDAENGFFRAYYSVGNDSSRIGWHTQIYLAAVSAIQNLRVPGHRDVKLQSMVMGIYLLICGNK